MVIWATLIGMFLPYSIAVFVGDLKLTPGKFVTVVLFLPAVFTFTSQLAQGRRHLMAPDLFAVATSIWVISAAMSVVGAAALVSSCSLVLEFLGMYIIGRAYVYGEPAFEEFVRALKIVLIVIVVFAIMDTLSGRFFINETMSQIFGTPDARSLRGDDHFRRQILGVDVIRASSTLDHPILLGAFCAMAAAILLYTAQTTVSKVCLILICAAGCLLSVSSAALLGMIIAVSVHTYDAILARFSWRWTLLLITFALLLAAVFIGSRDPVGWLITHLTLDEQTGYFRLLIWQHAFERIGEFLWAGNYLGNTDDPILENSIDSVWLVGALNFGLPFVILMLLTNLTTISSSLAKPAPPQSSGIGKPLSTAMTVVIVLFMFIGTTVHYWNALWMFWGLCLGIRASLSEYGKSLRRSLNQPRPALHDARLAPQRAR